MVLPIIESQRPESLSEKALQSVEVATSIQNSKKFSNYLEIFREVYRLEQPTLSPSEVEIIIMRDLVRLLTPFDTYRDVLDTLFDELIRFGNLKKMLNTKKGKRYFSLYVAKIYVDVQKTSIYYGLDPLVQKNIFPGVYTIFKLEQWVKKELKIKTI